MIKIGNANDIIDEDFVNKCTEYAMHFNPGKRDLAKVIEHTIGGEVAEILVCKYLGLEQTDFSIMEYDAVDSKGLKYEIKHTTKDTKWWNYRDNYSYFLKNAHDLDFILLCYYNTKTGDVFLKHKADAKTFKQFSAKSKFGDSHYYNIMKAAIKGACHNY